MRNKVFRSFSIVWLFFCSVASANCPLPPPATAGIVNATAGSIEVSWSAVAGAVKYRVTVYDQTTLTSLPSVYTSGTSVEIEGLDADTHNYLIGISAASCNTTDGFGSELSLVFVADIIIILDKILQFNCPLPDNGNYFSHPGSNQTITLPANAPNGDAIESLHIKAADINGAYVEFLVWADCYQHVRYHLIGMNGFAQTAMPYVVKYNYLSNNNPYLEVAKYIGSPSKIILKFKTVCLVNKSSCILLKNEDTCGAPTGTQQVSRSASQENNGLYVENQPVTMRAHYEAPALKAVPNPFGDVLGIQYEVRVQEPVSIELLNAAGIRVRTIVPRQELASGVYFANLEDAGLLTPGVYFAVVRTGEQVQTMPVIRQ